VEETRETDEPWRNFYALQPFNQARKFVFAAPISKQPQSPNRALVCKAKWGSVEK
jgi:hypothetical protein